MSNKTNKVVKTVDAISSVLAKGVMLLASLAGKAVDAVESSNKKMEAFSLAFVEFVITNVPRDEVVAWVSSTGKEREKARKDSTLIAYTYTQLSNTVIGNIDKTTEEGKRRLSRLTSLVANQVPKIKKTIALMSAQEIATAKHQKVIDKCEEINTGLDMTKEGATAELQGSTARMLKAMHEQHQIAAWTEIPVKKLTPKQVLKQAHNTFDEFLLSALLVSQKCESPDTTLMDKQTSLLSLLKICNIEVPVEEVEEKTSK